jgi:hypothetical protein
MLARLGFPTRYYFDAIDAEERRGINQWTVERAVLNSQLFSCSIYVSTYVCTPYESMDPPVENASVSPRPTNGVFISRKDSLFQIDQLKSIA